MHIILPCGTFVIIDRLTLARGCSGGTDAFFWPDVSEQATHEMPDRPFGAHEQATRKKAMGLASEGRSQSVSLTTRRFRTL